MHTYSIDQLIGWFKDGVIWWVLSWTVLRNIVTVPTTPPAWWFIWFSWGDWLNGHDADSHPFPALAEKYMLGVWRLLGEWVNESATFYASSVLTLARSLIGTLPSWAGTVAHGLATLLTRVGEGALLWASNAIQASQRLYDWLPLEIKVAGMSWSTLFEFVANGVKSWVGTTYAQFVSDARAAFAWAADQGTFLVTWYNSVGAWLTDLRWNFTDRITSTLGVTWTWLVAFKLNPKSAIDALYGSGLASAIRLATDAGPWLYNLWSSYHADLSSFLAEPGDWIVRRVTAEIERRW